MAITGYRWIARKCFHKIADNRSGSTAINSDGDRLWGNKPLDDTTSWLAYNRYIENFIQLHTWIQLWVKNPPYRIRFKLVLNVRDDICLENISENLVTICFCYISELLEIENRNQKLYMGYCQIVVRKSFYENCPMIFLARRFKPQVKNILPNPYVSNSKYKINM